MPFRPAMHIDQSTRLEIVCEQYYFPLRTSIRSTKTRYQYRLAMRSYGESLGRPAVVSDLADDPVTIWMGQLLDRDVPAACS